MRSLIKVAEIFGPTIQGEGPLIGLPTVFVRTGGCDFRCSWCDSMHAVDPVRFGAQWEDMAAGEVHERVLDLSAGFPMMVSMSGGNPALQPLGELIRSLRLLGYGCALETQGTVAQDWFAELDHLILSPKPPSAGMGFDPAKLDKCLAAAKVSPRTCLKVVVFDDADYEFARGIAEGWPQVPMYLSAGTSPLAENAFCGDESSRTIALRSEVCKRTAWLVERATSDHWNDVRILPQLHVLLWGDKIGV